MLLILKCLQTSFNNFDFISFFNYSYGTTNAQSANPNGYFAIFSLSTSGNTVMPLYRSTTYTDGRGITSAMILGRGGSDTLYGASEFGDGSSADSGSTTGSVRNSKNDVAAAISYWPQINVISSQQ